MTTCAQCQAVLPGDAIQLADGTRLCPGCFERRFSKPAAAARMNPAELFEYAKIAGMLVIVLSVGYLCYRVARSQGEWDKPSPELMAQAQAAAAERERAEITLSEHNLQVQRDAEKQRLLNQAKQDADAQLAHERMANEWAEKKAADLKRRNDALAEQAIAQHLREAKQEEQAERARQEIMAEKVKADLQTQREVEEAAAAHNAQIAGLKAKLAPLLDELAANSTARSVLDRKLKAFTVQHDTHLAVVKRMQAKYPDKKVEVGIRWTFSNSSAISPNADNLADLATWRENDRLAKLEAKEIEKVKAELTALNKGDADASAEADKLKQALSELGESTRVPKAAGATPLELAPAPESRRLPGLKTLYKKDGTTIQIKSAIAVGDEMQYTDSAGVTGTIQKSAVDHIERNADAPARTPDNGVNQPGKGVSF
jgi:hypothetical protein